jgi:hypothetical protein
LIINILVIVLIIIITFVPYDLPRIILGLPLVMFFPGYTLIAALFPKRDDIDSIERVALSFGLSIAVVVLIVLMLNYSPWGIKLYPILISLGIFILVTSLIARQLVIEPRLLTVRQQEVLLVADWKLIDLIVSSIWLHRDCPGCIEDCSRLYPTNSDLAPGNRVCWPIPIPIPTPSSHQVPTSRSPRAVVCIIEVWPLAQ